MRVLVLKRGKLVAFLMIFCGVIVAAAALVFLGSGALEAALGTKRYPINSVETTQPEVAITFDTIYSDANMSMIFSFLNKYNTKATFFATKDFVMQYRWEVETIVNSGHELMNLSNRYADMTGLSFSEIVGEISAAEEVVRNLSGKKPTMFRPPLGEYTNRMIEVADSLGYLTVRYSINAETYRDNTAEGLADKIIADIQNGSIIRLRVGITADTYALGIIIEHLENNGYRILPLSELLMKDDYEVDQNGVQRRTRITT